jgi:hypothetical protein
MGSHNTRHHFQKILEDMHKRIKHVNSVRLWLLKTIMISAGHRQYSMNTVSLAMAMVLYWVHFPSVFHENTHNEVLHIWTVLCDQVKKNEMVGICSMHGGDNKCPYNWKTARKETTSQI